jgi:hypothetical protein
MILPNRPRVTENGRSRSPDYNSNDRRLKSASTNRSKGVIIWKHTLKKNRTFFPVVLDK